MRALSIAGAAALACASCIATAAQPLVAEVYLMGPFPERVGMLERLSGKPSLVTVTTGVNSKGRALRHVVSVSGGVTASALSQILDTVQGTARVGIHRNPG